MKKTDLSESGVIAVVAGAPTTSRRTTTVCFQAGEEASLDLKITSETVER
jgi:hypothetical protein